MLELDDGRLYVGCTAGSVAERIQEHRCGTGARSSKRRKVMRYRRDLSPGAICATRQRAEALEVRVAERLRRRGFDVVQG